MSTCRGATPQCGTWRVFTSGSRPLRAACRAVEVIRAVNDLVGDLGMFAVDGGPAAAPWLWTRLAAGTRRDHRPAAVRRARRSSRRHGRVRDLSHWPMDGADVVLELVTLDRWRADIPHALRAIGAEAIGLAASGMGLALLVARPGDIATDTVSEALRLIGGADVRASEIGAHAGRFDVSALRSQAN